MLLRTFAASFERGFPEGPVCYFVPIVLQVVGQQVVGQFETERPFKARGIPAQAGIQSVGNVFSVLCEVDSRLRGNDCA